MDDVVSGLRIGIGGIRYEANSFAAGAGTMEDFTRNYVRVGAEVLSAESNTEVVGALRVAEEHGVTLVGLLDTFGGCGPLVEHRAYEELKRRYLDAVAAEWENLDAIYMPLHGAMATTECSDVEADLVGAVRALVGPAMPIVVSQDLHGAPSAALQDACTALIGFKTCPHIDYEPTGAKALRIAIDTLMGRIRPVNLRRPIPMLTPAEGHDTATGPMAEPMRLIQQDAERQGLIDVSVFMCQPWLDAARTGWCMTAVVDAGAEIDAAHRLLDTHADRLWAARERFAVEKTDVAQAIAELRGIDDSNPVILAEGGDSPSAGSTGDTTDLLAALVSMADPRPRLAIVADAAAAAELSSAGVGVTRTVRVGGSLSPRFAEPIELTGVVTAVSDGKYVARYPAGPTDIGTTVALQVGATTVVISSRSAMMLDQEAYRHLGLDPAKAWAIQVKSAGGFRALWASVTDRAITVDSRGASDGNLSRLPFAHAPQGLWPLSEPLPPQK